MSSSVEGFSSFMKLFIPPLSSWNTPSVSPRPIISMTFGSLKSIFSMSMSCPLVFAAASAAF